MAKQNAVLSKAITAQPQTKLLCGFRNTRESLKTAINEGSLVSKGHLCDSISMKKYIKEKSIENVFQGLGKFSDLKNFIAYFYVDTCESV